METEQKPSATVFSAAVSEGRVKVVLSDGRELSTPLEWYPTLAHASPNDLNELETSPFGIHWARLDEDLGLAGMLAGRKSDRMKPSNPKKTTFELAEYREQRRRSLLADSMIDYPDQRGIIGSFVNG